MTLTTLFMLALAAWSSATPFPLSDPEPATFQTLMRRGKDTNGNSTGCNIDQTQPPGDLTLCGNSTLFSIWRPRARFIAPEGWMNDPQGLFQRSDGSFHAGYQCHPQHYTWGNISQCSAESSDLVYWKDLRSWQDPKTLYPTEIYDIRGVFDGSIIKNGWQGYPTTIYTSTHPGGNLGATSDPPEIEGIETQSIAFTKDGGATWTKLPFGSSGNPVIYKWPDNNLTGFRDAFAFTSPLLSSLLSNTAQAAGDYFLTISGGIRTEADPSAGPRLWLYRQTTNDDVRYWTLLGEFVAEPAGKIFSIWSGNLGKNFETASVCRLNEKGGANDAGDDKDALNIILFGAEQGRPGSHENHWPLWAATTYSTNGNGSVSTNLDFVGVLDWGRVYAAVNFPVDGGRIVLAAWTYEDDENLVLTAQRGYQGAFTLFRDLYIKVIRKVDPSSPGISDVGSWKVRNETDGTVSIVTLGQKIIPEILKEYRQKSKVTYPKAGTLNGSAGYVPFSEQPSSRHYALTATLKLEGRNVDLPKAGFRILGSDQEWTDIYFDPQNETIVIDRNHSSLISSFGVETEYGSLRLWNILSGSSSSRQELNLTIVVDGSVVEVHANDVACITTRVYPWLEASKNVGFIVRDGGANTSVAVSSVELWDGLINAWPDRPTDEEIVRAKPLVWDGPMAGIWGLWEGV